MSERTQSEKATVSQTNSLDWKDEEGKKEGLKM